MESDLYLNGGFTIDKFEWRLTNLLVTRLWVVLHLPLSKRRSGEAGNCCGPCWNVVSTETRKSRITRINLVNSFWRVARETTRKHKHPLLGLRQAAYVTRKKTRQIMLMLFPRHNQSRAHHYISMALE